MKQTNLLSQIDTRKTIANSSSRKNSSAKITTPYSQILQESISDSSRQNSRNTNNSRKQNFNQNTSKYVAVNVLRGDANNDGVVDRKDIDLISQRMCDDIEGKSDKTKINMMNSDYDNDGIITLDDFSVAVENLTKQEKITVDVLHGDANDDGVVDEKDKELVLNRFFADMEGKGHTVKVNMRNVDFSGDGKITLEDFSRFMEIYNEQQKQSKTILKGDVNGDGKITQADAKTLENFYVGNTDDIVTANADMNDDGKISLSDLVKVQELADELDPKVLKGDANGDGKVNARDVRLIDRYILEFIDESQIDVKAADMNDNGKITLSDRFMLNQIISGQEAKLQTLKGDSNGDGVVDETDYKNIKDYFSGKYSSEDFIMKNSDVNGDGEIDEKDLQGVRNILDERPVDWDESKQLLGDVNGDGKIDMEDAVTIVHHVNKIEGYADRKDFYWDNADVNHDGNIDLIDSVRISKYFNGKISTLDEEIKEIQPPFKNAVITTQSDVYHNLYLIEKFEQIPANQEVEVLGMSSDRAAFKVSFRTSNGWAIGWVSADVVSEVIPSPPPPPPPAPVTEVAPPFTNGKVKFKAEVFGDLTLTWKVNSDEKVFAGETVRVTGMSSDGKALKIVYSSVYSGEKERWISADAIEEYKIPPVLQDLINTWEGKIWKNETTGKGNFECKDFAAYVFRKMYGVWYIGSTRSKDTGNNYRISINNPDRVGVRGEYEYLTKHNAQSLFSGAEAGDFVQMRRTHGGSHSAIVAGVTNEGVWFFEANAPDPDGSNYVYNKVKLQFHSWENLSEKNSSMSVYYAK